jgi:hypothetical protein
VQLGRLGGSNESLLKRVPLFLPPAQKGHAVVFQK